MWFPGQTAGTAISRVLFGDVNPSGKLPVTFPASDQQGLARSAVDYPGDGTDVYYSEGTLVGYRWFDAQHQEPLFPFRLRPFLYDVPVLRPEGQAEHRNDIGPGQF